MFLDQNDNKITKLTQKCVKISWIIRLLYKDQPSDVSTKTKLYHLTKRCYWFKFSTNHNAETLIKQLEIEWHSFKLGQAVWYCPPSIFLHLLLSLSKSVHFHLFIKIPLNLLLQERWVASRIWSRKGGCQKIFWLILILKKNLYQKALI